MLQARGHERGLGGVGQQIPRRGFGKVNTSYATNHVTSWDTILNCTALKEASLTAEGREVACTASTLTSILVFPASSENLISTRKECPRSLH